MDGTRERENNKTIYSDHANYEKRAAKVAALAASASGPIKIKPK